MSLIDTLVKSIKPPLYMIGIAIVSRTKPLAEKLAEYQDPEKHPNAASTIASTKKFGMIALTFMTSYSFARACAIGGAVMAVSVGTGGIFPIVALGVTLATTAIGIGLNLHQYRKLKTLRSEVKEIHDYKDLKNENKKSIEEKYPNLGEILGNNLSSAAIHPDTGDSKNKKHITRAEVINDNGNIDIKVSIWRSFLKNLKSNFGESLPTILTIASSTDPVSIALMATSTILGFSCGTLSRRNTSKMKQELKLELELCQKDSDIPGYSHINELKQSKRILNAERKVLASDEFKQYYDEHIGTEAGKALISAKFNSLKNKEFETEIKNANEEEQKNSSISSKVKVFFEDLGQITNPFINPFNVDPKELATLTRENIPQAGLALSLGLVAKGVLKGISSAAPGGLVSSIGSIASGVVNGISSTANDPSLLVIVGTSIAAGATLTAMGHLKANLENNKPVDPTFVTPPPVSQVSPIERPIDGVDTAKMQRLAELAKKAAKHNKADGRRNTVTPPRKEGPHL